jgi:hypothetical protein
MKADSYLKNWKCYAYHIYGDNSGKEWDYRELKKYFDINGTAKGKCINDLIGDQNKNEYYCFVYGSDIIIEITNNGFQIRNA